MGNDTDPILIREHSLSSHQGSSKILDDQTHSIVHFLLNQNYLV